MIGGNYRASFAVTQINGEPRIRDLDLAVRLEFADPRMIRKLIKSNSEKLNKISVLYAAAQTSGEQGGRPATEYYLDQKQAIFICMKSETDNAFEVQAEIVRVFDAHLNGAPAQPAFTIPQTLPEALRLAADLAESNAQQQARLAVVEPKAEALDRIATGTEGSLNITEAAKTLQVNPMKLFQWLSVHRWIYRRVGGSSWVAYQDKIQSGLLEHKIATVHRSDGSEKITEQVRVTAKGLARLAGIFRQSTGDAA